MAHKTFISYKYDEAQDLRNSIITALGDDATYYKGETSESPDLTDTSTETIKKHLTDMMYDTSVTIVIISPNMKKSKWIDWEIEYCLKRITRKDRTSQRNGVVGVIQKDKDKGDYSWFENHITNSDGCRVLTYNEEKVFDIIKNNRFNQKPKVYACPICHCVNALNGSYIAYVREEDFLNSPTFYINNAFEKSENDDYEIESTRARGNY